jgi:signal transduction histidine kinase
VSHLVRLRDVLRGRPLFEDVGLAVVFAAVAAIIGVALVAPEVPDPPPDPVIMLWAAAFMAPLALRRRWPLTVALVMSAHFLVFWQTGKNNDVGAWLGLGAGIYAAAAYGRRPQAQWLVVGCFWAATAWIIVGAVAEQPLGVVEVVAATLFLAVPCGLGWTLGSMMRGLRRLRAELEERNAELEAERQARARRSILDERVRIARELHDVVAHHVSLMTVQAAAARRLVGRRPDEAIASLGAVEEAGRAAITELQQLVGVLRRRDEGPVLAPQPGLSQLPALVTHMEQAGLPVKLRMVDVNGAVPGGVALSAYRIVQEALTNTLKHAGATRAEVTITLRDSRLEVEILDDGRGKPSAGALDAAPGGKGLVGMRERVAVYAGTLDAGPRPDGGYRVHAVLRGSSC